MTYDAADGYLLMVGGCSTPPVAGFCNLALQDSWALGPTGWALASNPNQPGGSPGPLYDMALAYDPPSGKVVLFGGAAGAFDTPPPSGNGPPPPPTFAVRPSGSTWSFLAGSWTNITAGGGPTPRYGARMAYDLALQDLVLFGGTNITELPNGTVLGDTWVWAGGSWTLQALPQAPPARWDAQMLFDPASNGIILLGGALALGTAGADEWELTSLLFGWHLVRPQLPPVPGYPDPRYDGMFVADLFDSTILLFGGSSPSGSLFSDAWSYTNAVWTELSSGVAFPKAPAPRWGDALTFLPSATPQVGEGVLFGGQECLTNRCFPLGDTWTFAHGVWNPVSPPTAPSARFGAAMAAYPPGGYVVLFGGCGIVCPLGDTWKFQAGHWTQIFPDPAPAARYFSSLMYDAKDVALVLFGGCLGGRGICPAADTWLYILGNWFNGTGLTGNAPSPRFGAGFDSSSGFAILYGGEGTAGALSDTWWFTNYTWQLLPSNPLGPQLAAVFPTFTYDPHDQVLLLWAGCSNVGCPLSAPFEYVFNGTFPNSSQPPPRGHPPPPFGWIPWVPTAGPWFPPVATEGAPAIWDPDDGPMGYVLFFGGRAGSGVSTGYTNNFVGGSWTANNAASGAWDSLDTWV